MTTTKSLNVWNTPLPTTTTTPKPMKTILTPPNKHKPKTTVTTPACTYQIDTYFTTVNPRTINNNEANPSPPHNQITDNTLPSITVKLHTINVLVLTANIVINTGFHMTGTVNTDNPTPAIKKASQKISLSKLQQQIPDKPSLASSNNQNPLPKEPNTTNLIDTIMDYRTTHDKLTTDNKYMTNND